MILTTIPFMGIKRFVALVDEFVQTDANNPDVLKDISSLADQAGLVLVLIGPSGVGKTTLCNAAGGLDLEIVSSSKRRVMLESSVGGVFGAADLNPKSVECTRLLWVRLYLREDEYRARRTARDNAPVVKTSQRAHEMSEWASLDECVNVVPVYAGGDVSYAWRNIFSALKQITLKKEGGDDVAIL